MRRCLGWTLGGSVALLVVCAVVGYVVVWPRLVVRTERAVANAMAATIRQSVSNRIEQEGLVDGGTLRLGSIDLDVNTDHSYGDAGVTVGSDGTQLYGFTTQVVPGGVQLFAPEQTYTGMPSVAGGRVEIVGVAASRGAFSNILSKRAFEQGLERGINGALAAHGLRPVAIGVGYGYLTITVTPTDSPSGVAR